MRLVLHPWARVGQPPGEAEGALPVAAVETPPADVHVPVGARVRALSVAVFTIEDVADVRVAVPTYVNREMGRGWGGKGGEIKG